jgi:hypothetical protein
VKINSNTLPIRKIYFRITNGFGELNTFYVILMGGPVTGGKEVALDTCDPPSLSLVSYVFPFITLSVILFLHNLHRIIPISSNIPKCQRV